MSEAPKARVLVVEDDPSIGDIMNRALSTRYEVKVCNNGRVGLEEAAKFQPQVMILDVNLPGMDGFQIAAALKEHADTKKIPLVFVTARDTPMDTIQGIKAGARHYLTKPFKLDELLSKISKIVGR